MLDIVAEYVKEMPGLTIDDADRPKLSKIISDNIQKMEGEKDENISHMQEIVELRGGFYEYEYVSNTRYAG